MAVAPPSRGNFLISLFAMPVVRAVPVVLHAEKRESCRVCSQQEGRRLAAGAKQAKRGRSLVHAIIPDRAVDDVARDPHTPRMHASHPLEKVPVLLESIDEIIPGPPLLPPRFPF